MNLRSSVNTIAPKTTQIFHFSCGNKRTIKHILTETLLQGEFTKFMLEDGRMILVNPRNVDLIEVFGEE